jgi:indole-3-acetate monooxygenase
MDNLLATRHTMLASVAEIGPILRDSGPRSEELGTLAPDAVAALRRTRMFQIKLPRALGGPEVDPVTEMLLLEEIAYHDLTSAWCTMVGATGLAAMGMFLTDEGLAQVFPNGHIPTVAISFFPAGRARREGRGFRIAGRWRFTSGIRHAEWLLGGTIVEGTEAENNGQPLVIFAAFPADAVTIHDNWGGVTGLRGTGSCDFSIEADTWLLPERAFVWDMMHPEPLRGGPSCLFPPFSYVAKEHGSVVIGAARRALEEIIRIGTTSKGTFRSARLADRHVFQRFVAESDLKLKSVRALIHSVYQHHAAALHAGTRPDGAAVAELRGACVYATAVATDIISGVYHFAGSAGLHHPSVIGRLLRDVHTAGIHQVMSDTAYENHGKFLLDLPADPMA